MNTNVAEEHSKTLQTKEKSGKRPDNSTNIFERNILDLYIDQPNHTICGGKYCMQDSFCFPNLLSIIDLFISQRKLMKITSIN